MKPAILKTLAQDGSRAWVRALDLIGGQEMLIDPVLGPIPAGTGRARRRPRRCQRRSRN